MGMGEYLGFCILVLSSFLIVTRSRPQVVQHPEPNPVQRRSVLVGRVRWWG